MPSAKRASAEAISAGGSHVGSPRRHREGRALRARGDGPAAVGSRAAPVPVLPASAWMILSCRFTLSGCKCRPAPGGWSGQPVIAMLVSLTAGSTSGAVLHVTSRMPRQKRLCEWPDREQFDREPGLGGERVSDRSAGTVHWGGHGFLSQCRSPAVVAAGKRSTTWRRPLPPRRARVPTGLPRTRRSTPVRCG